MKNTLFHFLILFIALLVAQVICSKIILFGVAMPIIYIYLILRLPLITSLLPPFFAVAAASAAGMESTSAPCSASSALATAFSSIDMPEARSLLMSPMHASHVG